MHEFDALKQGAPEQELELVPQAAVEYALPCRIGDYTDFYTGIHHARAVGKLFRPDSPLLSNYQWVPIGYHGRSSSIVVSGTPLRRPKGQVKPPDAEVPVFKPSARVDCELELGLFVGPGNALGEPFSIDEADEHAFGLTLLNDWSARDIQPWEYQPLGPFLAKNFGSTISPWIVTMEALEPFRGDLLGTGTISGPAQEEAGSLLELTLGGKQPITLPNGETRTFVLDGDILGIRAFAEKPGYRRIGFGPCDGQITPAI